RSDLCDPIANVRSAAPLGMTRILAATIANHSCSLRKRVIFCLARRMSMKTTSGISFDNAAVAATPKHLLQFAVDQRYDDYTSVDHAVWRIIMRQNIFFLKEYARKVYFQGLLNTGISFER